MVQRKEMRGFIGKCKWFLLGGLGLVAIGIFGASDKATPADIVVTTDPTPVVSKTDRFEVPSSEKGPEEGEAKVEMMKDRPKVVLSKWNGEVRMGVEYKKVAGNASKLASSNEVKWGSGQEIVHAYKKDDENFEIEIELKS